MGKKVYNNKFYSNREKTFLSARKIVPILMKDVAPKSVVDVGCGLGEFLAVFEENGVSDILGIDGEWVDKGNLRIESSKYRSEDLQKPLNIGKNFDLVISCEVAEHIKEQYANIFVESLTSLGNAVLFSAAIPLQGGTFHVNEQWPKYWADKFKEQGFVAVDYIRSKIWNDVDIKFWYKQNLILFVKEGRLENYPELQRYYNPDTPILSMVHPDIFSFYATSYKRFTRLIPRPLKWLLKKVIKF
ncbi:MAG: class I SAM-dependent methyltransferase [Cyclobacteriaceae bacterium]|nr:class I SAM-dependent methyltransferase [Cyclobacteriaceae bacterium]